MKTIIKRVHYGTIRSTMEWTDRLKSAVERATENVITPAANLSKVIQDSKLNQSKPMGSLSSLSERLAAKKVARSKFSDEMAEILDAMDAKEPEILEKAKAVAKYQADEIADLDSDLRQLSNSLNGKID